MRVTFQSVFRNSLYDINRTSEETARRQQEVSSGKRIDVASDDPSAMSTTISEKAEMATIDRYLEATDSVESRLTVVDTVLSDIIRQITNAQSRAAAGRNSFLTTTQRTAIAGEIRESASAMLTAISTQYRGMYLFSGGQSTTPPFTAGPPISPYQGDSSVAHVDVARGKAVQVTFDGGAILQGASAADLLQTLATLANDVQSGNAAGIDAALAELGQAFDRVTNAQTRVGLDLASLADSRGRLDSLRRASDARRSAAEDANLAESISGLTQADAAHRAALGALANAGKLSLMDYIK
jgi:flagellar hook-associated protein 3 FlgL